MITCRQLGPEDVHIWRPLRQEALRLFPLAFLTSVEEEQARSDAMVADQLSKGASHAVFDDAAPVGIAALLHAAAPRVRHRAKIAGFYVTPDAQGGGAAQALMEYLASTAEMLGAWQLELFVARTNPRAMRFYARNGFEKVGAMPNAIIGDGGPETDDFMIRLLPGAPSTADKA